MPRDKEAKEDEADSKTVDVLRYGKGDTAKHVTVPSGTGTMVIGAHRRDAGRTRLLRTVVFIALALIAAIFGTIFANVGVGLIAGFVVGGVGALQEYLRGSGVPELADEAVHPEKADERYGVDLHVDEPFEEGGDGEITDEKV
jgi:hypothetical protein